MSLREAAQQALEALEVWRDCLTDPRAKPGWRFSVVGEKAMNALRAALAEDVAETNFGNIVQVVDSTEADDIPDATKMIEPVAYVTGFTKGRCTIALVDPAWIPPVGMALYRSPPNQSEDTRRMVEPVAWRFHDGKIWCYVTHISDLSASNKFEPLYTAPPKREPLTEAELEPIRRRMMMEAYNAADDGDSERYNALKVMANDVLDTLLGGEK